MLKARFLANKTKMKEEIAKELLSGDITISHFVVKGINASSFYSVQPKNEKYLL